MMTAEYIYRIQRGTCLAAALPLFQGAAVLADNAAPAPIPAANYSLQSGNPLNETLIVALNLQKTDLPIVAGQFFLDYDVSKLRFINMTPGSPPFTRQISAVVDTVAGRIAYAVATPDTNKGTSAATTMALLTF